MHPPSGRFRSALVAVALVVAGAALVAGPVAAAPHPSSLTGGAPSAFAAVGPLRLADTRQADCGCTRLDATTVRVVITGRPGVPAGVSAAAVSVAATAAGAPGFVTAYPAGATRPLAATFAFGGADDTSSSAIVAVGTGGAIDVYASVGTDLIVDLTGVFTPAASSAAGRFRSSVPTRLLDTRGGAPLVPGGSVTVALPAGVDPDARALVVNVTSVGSTSPGFLSGHPAGSPPVPTAFLNVDGSGSAKGASTILPVSAAGLTIDDTAGGHVIVDLVGWFTGAGAAAGSDGLFVPTTPTRLLDTRVDEPRLYPGGTREVPSPVTAAALVTDVTMVEPDEAGFVTAYAAGTVRPGTATVNAPGRDAITSNLAVAAVSDRGVAWYSNAGTDIVVDVTGWFTGSPVTATLPVPPDDPVRPTALLVGDSTLGGFADVPRAKISFQGFNVIYDAKPCRRLVHPSCTSKFTKVAPNTALDAIAEAPGPIDIVVIKTGYNDGGADFATQVVKVVQAARARGARLVLWLTYSESTHPGSYDRSNAVLHSLAGTVLPDLVVAEWRAYAAASSGWYGPDRVHLMALGVYATGDYLSRWIAHLARIPCPQPWAPGQPIPARCPNPDDEQAARGGWPALRSLYGL